MEMLQMLECWTIRNCSRASDWKLGLTIYRGKEQVKVCEGQIERSEGISGGNRRVDDDLRLWSASLTAFATTSALGSYLQSLGTQL